MRIPKVSAALVARDPQVGSNTRMIVTALLGDNVGRRGPIARAAVFNTPHSLRYGEDSGQSAARRCVPMPMRLSCSTSFFTLWRRLRPERGAAVCANADQPVMLNIACFHMEGVLRAVDF